MHTVSDTFGPSSYISAMMQWKNKDFSNLKPPSEEFLSIIKKYEINVVSILKDLGSKYSDPEESLSHLFSLSTQDLNKLIQTVRSSGSCVNGVIAGLDFMKKSQEAITQEQSELYESYLEVYVNKFNIAMKELYAALLSIIGLGLKKKEINQDFDDSGIKSSCSGEEKPDEQRERALSFSNDSTEINSSEITSSRIKEKKIKMAGSVDEKLVNSYFQQKKKLPGHMKEMESNPNIQTSIKKFN